MMSLFLLQLAGAPGSGKSTLARAIADARPAVVLDTDVIKSALLDSGVAWALAGPTAYEVLFALATDMLGQGRNVILDSPSHYPHIPARGLAIASAARARYRFVECVCADIDELEWRLSRRTPRRSQMPRLGQYPVDAGDATPTAIQLGPHQWQTFRPPEGSFRIDTGLPLDTYLPTVLSFLDDPG